VKLECGACIERCGQEVWSRGRTGDAVVAVVAGGHFAVAVAEEAGHGGV